MGGSAFGAALVACGAPRQPPSAPSTPSPPAERALEAERVTPSPSPAPTPRPLPPRGREKRALLPGTEWATPLVITHSGVEGARLMVLGGVHGNESGGGLAAEEIAGWKPRAGSLLVAPRANVLATRAFVRTLPELGDLNRLYPGAADSPLPMARMAAAIVSAAREFEVDLLLDLHESWGFYAERTQDGTAFLGQTVTKRAGPDRTRRRACNRRRRERGDHASRVVDSSRPLHLPPSQPGCGPPRPAGAPRAACARLSRRQLAVTGRPRGGANAGAGGDGAAAPARGAARAAPPPGSPRGAGSAGDADAARLGRGVATPGADGVGCRGC